MKQNFVTEFIFIVVLILFSVYRYFYNVESVVMKVFSPTMAAVDLNGNRQIESGEIVCISGIKTFNNNLVDEELAKILDVPYKDALSLAYLTEDFSTSLLANKAVKFKPDVEQNNPDCTCGDILVDNKSYRETLLNEGYAYSDEFEYNSERLQKRIELVKDLQPVIMNRKSKKYHEIGCKFGKASEDYAVLLKNDLPENAVPCKWCHKPQENPQSQTGAKVYPDRISDGVVRMFLTDMTTHLNVKNDCSSNICQALLGEINNAKETIDIAAYGWVSVPQIDEALKKAVERGVKFRLVYDFSAREAYYPDTTKIARFAVETRNDLKAGNSRMSEYLMHNKFMIFDGRKVVTGSLNYSKTDFSEFNSNFILFVDSPEVAKVYTEEFEQMLSGKFHTDKTKRAQYSNYKLGNTGLRVYFSPQDNTITDKVIGYVDGAKKYIYMPVFVITHKSLETALLRANERGVDVRLIVDATNVSAKKSSVQNLRTAGVPVKVENYAGKLHSKSIIIDDEYILAGSMNFSRSGESRNDENMMIIKNPRLAVFYKDFFLYLWGKIPDIYLTRNPRAESIDSIGSCFDGIDNDFDGKIDKADEGCFIRSK